MEDYLIKSNPSFEAEGDFCGECGAILKLDHKNTDIACKLCHHTASLRNVIGVKYNYEIEFTLPGHYSLLSKEKKNRKKQDDDGMSGQMDNERDCGKCGHKGMSYTTMQLRSADEGQTVFYFCPSCKNREVENS